MHRSYYDIGVPDSRPYSIVSDNSISIEELYHFNPNHDSLGRFARKAGSGVRTAYSKAKSAYKKANEVVDKVQEVEKERIIRSGNQAYVYKNRHKLTDKELDMAMTRIRKEKELKEMGRSDVNKALRKYGGIAVESFARSAGGQAGKALFKDISWPKKDKDKDKDKDKGNKTSTDNNNKTGTDESKPKVGPRKVSMDEYAKQVQRDPDFRNRSREILNDFENGKESIKPGKGTFYDDLKNDSEKRRKAMDIINRVDAGISVSDLSNEKNGRYVDLGESYINPHNQRYVVKDRDKKKSKVKTVIPFNTVVIS